MICTINKVRNMNGSQLAIMFLIEPQKLAKDNFEMIYIIARVNLYLPSYYMPKWRMTLGI